MLVHLRLLPVAKWIHVFNQNPLTRWVVKQPRREFYVFADVFRRYMFACPVGIIRRQVIPCTRVVVAHMDDTPCQRLYRAS